jgi:toxin ParE1/3/4
MRLRFSRRAEADLAEITAYIAQGNPARAVTFVRELRAHCQGLLTFPAARPSRPELGEGVRLSVFGNYVVLYVLHQDILEIRRVVHGARDLADID